MLNNYRPTWAEINLNNLRDNLKIINKSVSNKEIIPVVKADAYGHGALEVVSYLMTQNISLFAVSLLEEALELRNSFKNIDILVLGAIDSKQLEQASINNLIITIYSYDFGLEVLRSSYPLRTHLKIDTGMNRLGLKSLSEINELVTSLHEDSKVKLEGIYTHFATSDDNEMFMYRQLDKFKSILIKLKEKPKIIHVSNSSAILKYENTFDFTTHARLGISLYGLSLEKNIDVLKPVMTLKTKIVQFKRLEPGECVGYGITYTATKKERIGVIPIGYADGLIRKNNIGHVEINGNIYPFVGRICMDYAFVEVDEDITYDDEVIIMGGNIVTIDKVAERLETISYEIVCQVSKRVPRKYIGKDE